LKLKAGSLLNEFADVDLAFSPNGKLLITLVKKGGLFGGGDKKKPATRAAVIQHSATARPHALLEMAAVL
jgi:hypothetical protein